MPIINDDGPRHQDRLFSTAEAAKYLWMSVSTVKYHVHVAGNLCPRKIGGRLIFTQRELDYFLSHRRPPGRPKLKETHE